MNSKKIIDSQRQVFKMSHYTASAKIAVCVRGSNGVKLFDGVLPSGSSVTICHIEADFTRMGEFKDGEAQS